MPRYVDQEEFKEWLCKKYKRDMYEGPSLRCAIPPHPKKLYCRNVFKENEVCEVFALTNNEKRSLGECEVECRKTTCLRKGEQATRSHCWSCHDKLNSMWLHRRRMAERRARVLQIDAASEGRGDSKDGEMAVDDRDGGARGGYETSSDEDERDPLRWRRSAEEEEQASKRQRMSPQGSPLSEEEQAAKAAEKAEAKKDFMWTIIYRVRADRGLELLMKEQKKRRFEKAGSSWPYVGPQATDACEPFIGEHVTGREVARSAPGWERFAQMAPEGCVGGWWAKYYPDEPEDDPAFSTTGIRKGKGRAGGEVKPEAEGPGSTAPRAKRWQQQLAAELHPPSSAALKKSKGVVVLSDTNSDEQPSETELSCEELETIHKRAITSG